MSEKSESDVRTAARNREHRRYDWFSDQIRSDGAQRCGILASSGDHPDSPAPETVILSWEHSDLMRSLLLDLAVESTDWPHAKQIVLRSFHKVGRPVATHPPPT